ncbi:MAG TPA: hypothetical protein VMG12_41720, partial [Polyangiaceae bacterium]|nr:hypothetical protein [Polyangiaceae bacterium]
MTKKLPRRWSQRVVIAGAPVPPAAHEPSTLAGDAPLAAHEPPAAREANAASEVRQSVSVQRPAPAGDASALADAQLPTQLPTVVSRRRRIVTIDPTAG